MGDYQYNLSVTVRCDDTGLAILSTSMPISGQTLAQLYAAAQSQLIVILGELAVITILHPCSGYSLEIKQLSAGIDFTVNSSTILLLIAAAYTELIYVLATL